MRHALAALLVGCLATVGAPSAHAQVVVDPDIGSWDTPGPIEIASLPSGEQFVRGEILVGLRDWNEYPRLEAFAADVGDRILGGIPNLGILRVGVRDGQALSDAISRYSKRDEVAFAEPHGVGITTGGTPPVDDTWFALQWHLENTGQFSGTPGADIEAVPAWGIQSGKPAVVVAVLDTGIVPSHKEFEGRLLPGFDFVAEDPDPSVTGNNFHGVYVTGIIAANANNAFGVAGVDHGCMILPVKVLNTTGAQFDLIQGINYAVLQGADIINMSLINGVGNQALKSALNSAKASGVVLIASAGNGGIGDADQSWPGKSAATISIGSTWHTDSRSGQSGTGAALDFVAPGCLTTVNEDPSFDFFQPLCGTSASAAVASGIAALLKAENPTLSPDDVYELFKMGAEDQVGWPVEDTPGWDPFYGHGRLNAFLSLSALCSCSGGELLRASPATVGAGGTQVFNLDAGPDYADMFYLLLGSISGTSPGQSFGHLTLSLNADDYFRVTYSFPNMGALVSTMGILDSNGEASAQVLLPSQIPASVSGMQVHHAYLVMDRAQHGLVVLASNATSLVVE